MVSRPHSAPNDLLIPVRKKKRNNFKRSKTCIEDEIQNSSDEESEAFKIVLNKSTLRDIMASLTSTKSSQDVVEISDEENEDLHEGLEVSAEDTTHHVVETIINGKVGDDEEAVKEVEEPQLQLDNISNTSSNEVTNDHISEHVSTEPSTITGIVEKLEYESQNKENYPDTSQTLIPTQTSAVIPSSLELVKRQKVAEETTKNLDNSPTSSIFTITKENQNSTSLHPKIGLSNSSVLNKPSPRYRVGLSKRAHVESLHSYLRK